MNGAMTVDPLRIHRLIWYNYLYYIDREKDIPEKLNTWALYVSRQYILEHQPSSLSLNTQIAWKHQVIRDIVDQDTHMDDVEPTVGNDGEQQSWIEIQSKEAQQRLDSKNRSKAVDQQTGLRDAPATPVPGNPINDSISNLQPNTWHPTRTRCSSLSSTEDHNHGSSKGIIYSLKRPNE